MSSSFEAITSEFSRIVMEKREMDVLGRLLVLTVDASPVVSSRQVGDKIEIKFSEKMHLRARDLAEADAENAILRDRVLRLEETLRRIAAGECGDCSRDVHDAARTALRSGS